MFVISLRRAASAIVPRRNGPSGRRVAVSSGFRVRTGGGAGARGCARRRTVGLREQVRRARRQDHTDGRLEEDGRQVHRFGGTTRPLSMPRVVLPYVALRRVRVRRKSKLIYMLIVCTRRIYRVCIYRESSIIFTPTKRIGSDQFPLE